MSKTVLVTGANGYIGKALGKKLLNADYSTKGAVRHVKNDFVSDGYQAIFLIGSINGSTSWKSALEGVDCVIHLAGCAHKYGLKSTELAERHKIINSEATANLAKQCVRYGVKRFIFISSIGVLGNDSLAGIITNDSPYDPKNSYAISKMEAEKALDLLSDTSMEIIILRPPLVYGRGAPGNFTRLVGLISVCRVLPFGMFCASRSMISLENLCDLIIHCLSIPAPSKNKFVVSDSSDWTTEQLISLIAEFLKVRVHNLKVPVLILRLLTKIIGRSDDINKLAYPLIIDSTDTRLLLDWSPKQDPYEGLQEAVENFKKI